MEVEGDKRSMTAASTALGKLRALFFVEKSENLMENPPCGKLDGRKSSDWKIRMENLRDDWKI